jgi:hypothetical protein
MSYAGILPVQPNPPLVETVSLYNEALVAYNRTEQRRELRGFFTRGLEGTWGPGKPQDSQLLNNALLAWPDRLIGVPWWPSAAHPTSAITATDTLVNVDTTGVPWEGLVYVIAWVSAQSYEVQLVDSIHSGHLHLDSAWAESWPTTCWIMPLWPCWLEGTPEVEWLTQTSCRARLRFTAEIEQ